MNTFELDYYFTVGSNFNYIGNLLVALGHVGAVMLVRIPLTNYLTHSLICTTLFYGYGFGLFASINRAGLLGIVVAIWIFQLAISPS